MASNSSLSVRKPLVVRIAIVALFVAITPAFWSAAVASAGAGHGSYLFAKLLFPYSMVISGFRGIGIVAVVMALAQWPTYGLMLAATFGTPRYKITTGLIISIHCVVVIVVVLLDRWYSGYFRW